jgi:hypothetical protein
LDEKDRCAELEDEVAMLRSEIRRLCSRPAIPVDAPLEEKDRRIRELEKEVMEMEVVLRNQGGDVDLVLGRERRRADRAEAKVQELTRVLEEERKVSDIFLLSLSCKAYR